MTSNKPYIVRAIFDWIVDNDCTPYVLVDAYAPEISIPMEYVRDGKIILNISPEAVKNFSLTGEHVFFSARFGGIPMDVFVPIAAILKIYSKESGQGVTFDRESYPEQETTSNFKPSVVYSNKNNNQQASKDKANNRAQLRLVR